MDAGVRQQVKSIMDRYGIPEYVWYPICMKESRGNPKAWNRAGEDSRGLFQINLHAHPEYADLNLFDPRVNAEIAARDFLLNAYQNGRAKGLVGEDLTAYVWRYGIRPKWTTEKEKSIKQLTREFLTGKKIPAGQPIPAEGEPAGGVAKATGGIQGFAIAIALLVGVLALAAGLIMSRGLSRG